ELVGRKLESFFIKHAETSALYYTYGDVTDDRLTLEEDKYTIITGGKKLGTLSLGKMIAQVKTISSDDISMEFEINSTKFKTITGSDVGLQPPLYPTVSRETLTFPFGKLSIILPASTDINNLNCTIKVRFKNTDVLAATTTYKLVIKKTHSVQKAISLYTTPAGAQYMEWDGYRTRLNTLFTRQLIERAN
ncbi:hypothetical protein, partial [Klebsiella pneumoniae]